MLSSTVSLTYQIKLFISGDKEEYYEVKDYIDVEKFNRIIILIPYVKESQEWSIWGH